MFGLPSSWGSICTTAHEQHRIVFSFTIHAECLEAFYYIRCLYPKEDLKHLTIFHLKEPYFSFPDQIKQKYLASVFREKQQATFL